MPIIHEVDGKLAVTYLVDEKKAAEVNERHGFGGEIVPPSAVPPRSLFRGAWIRKPGGVEVDMPQARALHMDDIRKGRDAKLRELDVEQLRGNSVEAQKQALRDLPQTFDLNAAQTPEQLKALWPDELT